MYTLYVYMHKLYIYIYMYIFSLYIHIYIESYVTGIFHCATKLSLKPASYIVLTEAIPLCSINCSGILFLLQTQH
jgi:hypothetical protein